MQRRTARRAAPYGTARQCNVLRQSIRYESGDPPAPYDATHLNKRTSIQTAIGLYFSRGGMVAPGRHSGRHFDLQSVVNGPFTLRTDAFNANGPLNYVFV